MKDKVKIDALITGRGIVGILTALEYEERFPNSTIALINRAHHLKDQTTGRNSDVLHVESYCKTDSLKHKLSLEANTTWKDLSKKTIFHTTRQESILLPVQLLKNKF